MWRRNTDAKHCVQCGYNLTGNVSGICPECGASASDARRPARWPGIALRATAILVAVTYWVYIPALAGSSPGRWDFDIRYEIDYVVERTQAGYPYAVNLWARLLIRSGARAALLAGVFLFGIGVGTGKGSAIGAVCWSFLVVDLSLASPVQWSEHRTIGHSLHRPDPVVNDMELAACELVHAACLVGWAVILRRWRLA